MSLLLPEPPLVVQRGLIVRCEGNVLDALMCQQISYWMDRATKQHEGYAYVYKTYDAWAAELGVSAKTARGALDRLRKLGFVVGIQNPNDPRDRTLWWRVDRGAVESGAPYALAGSSPDPAGSQAAPGGSSSTGATEAETETTAENTAESAGAGAPDSLLPDEPKRKPVTYRGKTVPRPLADDAVHLLTVFNEATGGHVGAFGANGKQSENLTRIVGALTDRPGVEREVWERGVRAMVANPPGWVDGKLAIGHLFGPRAADHTLSRAAASQSGGQQVASDEDTDTQGWSRNDF